MRIVHIINSFDKINFGIWNAALFASSYLKDNYSINSCAVVCSTGKSDSPIPSMAVIWAGVRPAVSEVCGHLAAADFLPGNTLVISHGCWLEPTRLGRRLKERGFMWIYVPHGMLEPWSMANHRWKKLLYFYLFERRFIKTADAVRAVGRIEQQNLLRFLKRDVKVIENGVVVPQWKDKDQGSINFLFMARLHHKKGILPLIKAWDSVMRDSAATLIIAGPDEGELEEMMPYLNGNINYVGAIYGEDKEIILRKCHYYILPSYSEGFPTSVLEAMSYGLIPLISKGCNFEEVFSRALGFQVEPNDQSIIIQLARIKNTPYDHVLSKRNHDFIRQNYSEEVIGERLYNFYKNILVDSSC
jgi:glycosyltransferase involved in cell wall biosynthesis